MIHSSHSRKDLLELCDIFNIRVEDKFNCSKKQLSEGMWDSINSTKKLVPDDKNYHLKSKKDLIEYLKLPHQTKSLSISDKQEIIKYCRQIIFYCDNNYTLEPHFDSIQHLETIAIYISNFGDISTVRRALAKLKLDKQIACPDPIISARVLKELEKQKRLKCCEMNSLRVKKGKIIVKFD